LGLQYRTGSFSHLRLQGENKDEDAGLFNKESVPQKFSHTVLVYKELSYVNGTFFDVCILEYLDIDNTLEPSFNFGLPQKTKFSYLW
jgi:hypothetical protein